MSRERELIEAELDRALVFSPTPSNDSRPPDNGHLQDGVILVNGSQLKPKPVHWLWKGWLARGNLCKRIT